MQARQVVGQKGARFEPGKPPLNVSSEVFAEADRRLEQDGLSAIGSISSGTIVGLVQFISGYNPSGQFSDQRAQ